MITVFIYSFYYILFYFNVATMRMAGAISKSTDVMHVMNDLVKLPEIRAAMMDLSKEMAKVINLKYSFVYFYLCYYDVHRLV